MYNAYERQRMAKGSINTVQDSTSTNSCSQFLHSKALDTALRTCCSFEVSTLRRAHTMQMHTTNLNINDTNAKARMHSSVGPYTTPA